MSSYADAELLIVGYLTAAFPSDRACVELPASWTGRIIQVERIAGIDPLPSLDQPTVDIECLAPTRLAATEFANQVRRSLRFAAPGYTALGATIARVDTIVGPGWRPYANTNVRRIGATYQITLHNHL
jgi:hypothetical protein